MFVVKANYRIIAILAGGIVLQRAQRPGICQVGILWDLDSLVRSTLESSMHVIRLW